MCGADSGSPTSFKPQPRASRDRPVRGPGRTGKPHGKVLATVRKPHRKKAGRKTKFTFTTRRKIIGYLKRGHPRSDAAMLAGVGTTLFFDWLKKGRENRGPVFLEFLKSVEAAEATWRSTLIGSVSAGAMEDPDLALRALGIRDPENWAKKEKVDVHHDGDVTHHIILEDDD